MANKSGNIDHEFGAGGKGYTLRISWEETSINAAENTSTVKCVAKLIAENGYGITSTKAKQISITCDGKTQSGTCHIAVEGGKTITLFTATFSVPHNADGTKTAAISCRLDIEITISGIYVGYVQGSGNAVLTAISRQLTAPTAFAITAGFGIYVGLGDAVTLTWSGASGNITGYQIQYSRGNNGWKTLKSISSTATSGNTTDSFTNTDIAMTGAGKNVKYRIRSMNGSLASAWKESNTLIITGSMDLKVSSAWKTGSVWIKVNGAWKRAKRVWIKVDGVWKYSK